MRTHFTWRLLAICSLLLSISTCCHAENRSVLCTDGVGTFDASLPYGKFQVHVGATRKGSLGVRSCEAILTVDGVRSTVASDIPILDLDVFGVEMGIPTAVAAFQIKKSKDDCCMTYQIYSLQKSPRLLRTLTGGSFFSASDTDPDGQVEIWTDDAAAVRGFDGLYEAEFDFAPPMVLRFENGKLLDVTFQFVKEVDRQIEKVRLGLRAEDIKDFKSSDGRLQSTALSEVERIHRLRLVKAAVLDIVWAYLYSGREEEAWRNLMEMWPASDVDRIRAAIEKARSNGLRTQLDGLSTQPLPQVKNQVKVFASTTYATIGKSQPTDVPARFSVDRDPSSPEVTPPNPILIRRLSLTQASAQALPMGDLTLTVVIDSAGKVVSAQPMGTLQWFNSDLMSAIFEWKFVPAFHGKHPVASTMVKIISPQQ